MQQTKFTRWKLLKCLVNVKDGGKKLKINKCIRQNQLRKNGCLKAV